MRNLRWIVLAVLVAVAPARADAVMSLRLALNEARMQMSANGWDAADRVLKSLRQQMILQPALDKYRTKVEFVIWDLRMGNHDAALKDLDALAALISAKRP